MLQQGRAILFRNQFQLVVDDPSRKWICMSILIFILAALPFWYLKQNLDNGSMEEITTIANIFEKVLSF